MALLLKQSCFFRQVSLRRCCVTALRLRTYGTELSDDERSSSEQEVPHEIYKGSLTTQVRGVKTFSLGTSLMGIGMQPILYEKISTGETSLPLIIALCSTIGLFTFVTPFLIHFVAKKYVTDIVFDPVTLQYTASVYNFFPTKRKIIFKLEDVVVPDVPGAFTSFRVKNIPLLCSPNDFVYPEHYIKFMGYDKPIDLHLRNSEEKSKDSTTVGKSP